MALATQWVRLRKRSSGTSDSPWIPGRRTRVLAFCGIDAIRNVAVPSIMCDLRSDNGLGQLNRLKDNARPQKYLIGAITFLGLYLRPQSLCLRGVPDLKEAFLTQITQGRVVLADTDVSVGVD